MQSTTDSPIRIWHQSMTDLEPLPEYRRGLERRAVELLGDRVDVSVRGLAPGSYAGHSPSDVLGYPFAYQVVLSQVLEYVRHAEERGFDAFVVGSFSEPFLPQLRSAVDIPVVGLAESSLLTACNVGSHIGLVANAESLRHLVRKAVRAHGLGERVNEIASMRPELNEERLEKMPAADLVAAFVDTCRGVVERGADVLIPAEGVLANVVSDQGLREVDGAPVLDSLAAAWHAAEALVRLRRSTGLSASRAAYPRAPEEMVAGLLEAAGRR